MASVEVTEISKSFGQQPVLCHVSLTCQNGEGIWLQGPNGAGKTTLLKIMAGVIEADAGTIRTDGVISGGALWDQPGLYADLTVAENLMLVARLQGVAPQVAEWLAEWDLTGAAHTRARHLSRGTRQRVSWVRTILHQPTLLILDEPWLGLDQKAEAQMCDYLTAFVARGGMLLMAAHHHSAQTPFITRAVTLNHGEIADAPAR